MRDDIPIIGQVMGAMLREERAARESEAVTMREAWANLSTSIDAIRAALDDTAETAAAQASNLLGETLAQHADTLRRVTADDKDALAAALAQRFAELTQALQDEAAALAAELRAEREAMRSARATMAENIAQLQAAVMTVLANVRDGEPGPEGPPGRDGSVGAVKQWQVGAIYQAGDVVALPRWHPSGWAIAKAVTDTYEIPGDDNAPWIGLVYHGEDGAAGPKGEPGQRFRFRGTHRDSATYDVGDVVNTDAGTLWVRVRDAATNTIPGEGWAVMLRAPRGERGAQGIPGPAGASVLRVELEGAELVLTMTDGATHRVLMPVLMMEGGGP